jgi:hypothetical protein
MNFIPTFTHHVLYFTSEEHCLYRSSGKALELEARFAPDESGIDAFREYLRGRRGALFAIVADVAGEDFHEDQIPFLRGADREAVVQRRLAQRYRDTRLAAALSLGHVSTPERRNERLLLASFTNTNQVAPWLDVLEDSDARLAGVYSVPLLAPALAARLGQRAGRCFVVTMHRAGLRQCFVEDGRLRFARLERAIDLAPQALATFARSETLRLAQYLTTLRALPRDGGPVAVLVVAPQGQRAAFAQALSSDSRLVFTTVDAEDAVRKVGLRQLPAGTLAEGLYLHLAAKKPPREQFASRDDRRRYYLWQLQRGIVAAGALGLAACALYAGGKGLDSLDLRGRAATQAREAQAAADQYARITAGFPVTQTSSENLKVAVLEFQRIVAGSPLPESAFIHVSRVLERFPQFEIDRINWSVGRADEQVKPTAVPADAKPAAQGDAVRLEISGRVNATQRDDYRGITAQVQRFAGALAVSGYQLARTQLPFDITSEGTLTGDIGGGTDSAEAPRFTVVLLRRLP